MEMIRQSYIIRDTTGDVHFQFLLVKWLETRQGRAVNDLHVRMAPRSKSPFVDVRDHRPEPVIRYVSNAEVGELPVGTEVVERPWGFLAEGHLILIDP